MGMPIASPYLSNSSHLSWQCNISLFLSSMCCLHQVLPTLLATMAQDKVNQRWFQLAHTREPSCEGMGCACRLTDQWGFFHCRCGALSQTKEQYTHLLMPPLVPPLFVTSNHCNKTSCHHWSLSSHFPLLNSSSWRSKLSWRDRHEYQWWSRWF